METGRTEETIIQGVSVGTNAGGDNLSQRCDGLVGYD